MPVEGVKKSAVSFCVLVILVSAVLTLTAVIGIVNKFNHDADITFSATLFAADVIAPSNYFQQVDKVVKEPVIEAPTIQNIVSIIEPEPTMTPEVSEDGDSSAEGIEGAINGVGDGGAIAEPDYIGKGYVYIREDGSIVYHIVSGDTLTAISRRVGVSIQDLGEYNHIQDLNLIIANTDLLIPPDKYPGYDVLFGLTFPTATEEPPVENQIAAMPLEPFSLPEREPDDDKIS